MKSCLFIFIFASLWGSCRNRHPSERMLNQAAQLIYSSPQQALKLLDSISQKILKRNARHNLYLLKVHADRFACIDPDGLPTGEIKDVKGTSFDFNEFAYIGDRVDNDDEQLQLGKGFDHPMIFNTKENQVELVHEKTGRKLTVSTTLPQAQIYTANYLDGRLGKYGQHYNARDAICIETQNMPDAIHLEENPSTILKAGDTYDEKTSYKFEVIKNL